MEKLNGFISYQNSDDENFYFQFLNEEGGIILVSNPYSHYRNRDRALNRFRKYAANPSRYKVDLDSRDFKIVAANHKIQGESIVFSSKKEMNKAIKLLQKTAIAQVAKLVKNPSKQKKTKSNVSRKVKKNSLKKQEQVQEELRRFNFNLTFYQQEKGGKLVGKIMHPLKEEKMSFKGINLEKIEKFLISHLPKEVVSKLKFPTYKQKEKTDIFDIESTIHNRTDGQNSRVANVIKNKKTQLFNIQLPMNFHEVGQVENGSASQSGNIELVLTLPDYRVKPIEHFFKATAYIKSLSTGRKILLAGNFKGSIFANSPEITIPITFQNIILEDGLYRIMVSLYLADDPFRFNYQEVFEGVQHVNILNNEVMTLNRSMSFSH